MVLTNSLAHPATGAHLRFAPGRLRVCVAVPFDMASPGGVKHTAMHMAAALRGRGNDVTIVGPSPAPFRNPHIHTFGGIGNARQFE